ncbi:Yip1 family protein [Paludisphaera mucosa]|uniref:Yip1 family protein n=1 Tax=Paludisphaera mucosa TaxID=3030827 RepID=A0ABT6FKC9_9BACT|nr:Yip1 family protein [Paludisphaera mucosa]MDG3008032.1 Yip1 family protein [Paludisphaera mucosa]
MSATDPLDSPRFGDAYEDFDPVAQAKKPEEAPSGVGRPFATIMTSPRRTFRRILASDPAYRVAPLSMLSGVDNALDRAAGKNLGDRISTSAILAMAVLLGPLGGVIGVYFLGWLFSWSGRRLGGAADSRSVRAAIAWAQAPIVLALLIWAVQLAVFGGEMFTKETPRLDADRGLLLLYAATMILDLVLGVWMFVLLLKCLGEAHGFSAWRALGAILLGGLAMALPILLLVFGLAALTRTG